ncbi:hypothetical protein [Ramlibacter sp. PS4R-6]|uniref:hypothetical protein n=1 Tax=Ramlibacter sp. PS4R-6 TaxID=3133438 RepID=UPI0030A3DDD8
MAIVDSPKFLRYVLLADSASCVATGAVQVLLAATLADLFRLPAMLLMGTGVFLLAYAAVVAFIGTREVIPRGFVWLFVAGNFGWAAGCVALLAAAPLNPTAPGQAWVIAQAITVVILAELQWAGLRSRPAGWA